MQVLVTGASRGLGKAIAEAFAAEGHNLILVSLRPKALYDTLEELQLRFPSVSISARPFDLGRKEEVLACAEWVNGLNIVPDILVNNAGTFLPGSVYNEPEGTLETMLDVNLFSAYYLTRALLPRMMERKSGHIFNMCSVASLKAYASGGSYSISKFALLGFSRNLREEMKPFGIKVTSVLPGATYTDSWASSGLEETRFMKAEDIAAMIVACAKLSPQAVVEELLLRPQPGDI